MPRRDFRRRRGGHAAAARRGVAQARYDISEVRASRAAFRQGITPVQSVTLLQGHLIGIDPDGRVHVSERLLMLHDGPSGSSS